MTTSKVILYFPKSDILDVDFWPTIECEGELLSNGVLLRIGPGCVLVQAEILDPIEKGFKKVVQKVLEKFRNIDDLAIEKPSRDWVREEKLKHEYAECIENKCPDEYFELEEDESNMVFGEGILDWDPGADTFIVNLRHGPYVKVEMSPLGVKLYRDDKGRIARIEVPQATKKGLLQAVYRYIVREVEGV